MSLLRSAAFLCCLTLALPAHAMTMKECSAKFAEAKKAGALNGAKWSDFRASQCNILPDASTDEKAKPAAAFQIPEGVTFPDKVDSKFASETAAKQRMRTCLDSYKANRDAKTLNGMKWIQKGGGYYSACSARLKGNS